jgi:hypothetical protein
MNWRAGLLRAWIVIAVLWIGIAIWQFANGCWWFWGTFPVCENGKGSALAGLEAFTASDWIAWLGFVFGLPVTLLFAGLVSAWIIGGFRKSQNSN